jgi:ribonuclease G
MNKELYVSTTPHETKVALVEDDQLAEVYFERENEYTLAGSIYKGRVTRVLPGMQSAFVDIGLERDAFLYVSDFLELQDEDEDGEFGDVKVTGSTLADANGLIIAEPQPVEEEDSAEPQEDAAIEGEGAQAEAKEEGAPRWRGRRRRRGRRGGRDRVPGERPAEAQPGTAQPEAQAGEQESGDEFEETAAEREPEAPREPRKRELRGFEPRGLVVHGLAHSVSDDEIAEEAAEDEPEAEAVKAPAAEAQPAESAATSYTPMLLPGESISKYNRAEGEVPAPAPAAESAASYESDRDRGGYGRGRDRDRGGRGRRGDRDRDRDRGREREPREPREFESTPLPENYTPIVLPGESISKYRGVEPVSVPELAESAAPVEPIAVPETTVTTEIAETVAPAEQDATAKVEANPTEPLSSASYSGVSGLPSMTQRHAVEAEEEVHTETPAVPAELTQEAMQEPMLGETAAAVPTVFVSEVAEPAAVEEHRTEQAEDARPETSQYLEARGDEVHAEPATDETEPEAADKGHEARSEGRGGRRSWRDRVSKIFGGTSEGHAAQDEPREQVAGTETHAVAPVEEPGAKAAPETIQAAENVSASHGSQLGSFVIEGGHVEHEELDEDEAEMPALAEHFDRYEENEAEDDGLEDVNGSQIGAAVRESGEENELEDEEYDFGGEEFEESEMLAEEASGEDEGEEQDETEGPEESDVAATPATERQRPERFERRERRGRRGTPPPRGGGRMRPRQQSRALPLISELLKEGQEILVQIAKEPIGKKGARITSHIALPGRFLVYMPTVNHIGVSRKISSEEERQRLKRIVSSERENGHGGFIVRTAASNIKEDELRADIRFLKHLWTEIRTRAESSKSPSLIYHDLNLVERILRDQVTSDFSQIWVDNEGEYERVVRFASRFQPSLVRRIKLYTKDTPLYEQFGINEEINKSLKSKVWLKSGGYIVINQTEALVAIDINTGKYVGKTARLEDTIVKTNCDAVKEIVRQIRLRDLGGIIVVDFIDMDERKNRQKVMQALEEAMKADRAPSKILQFNDFGLVAITRKRVKQSLERTLGTPCPYCDATGFVKSVQTVCNEIYVEMRKVRRHVESKEVILRVNPDVAKELKSGNGKWLQEMEELIGHPVLVKSDAQLHQEKFDMNY